MIIDFLFQVTGLPIWACFVLEAAASLVIIVSIIVVFLCILKR